MATKVVKSPNGCFTLFFADSSPFSNFYYCHFEATSVDGSKREFSTSEQYFMYNKAQYFKCTTIAEEMMKLTAPLPIKRLGRLVENFDEDKWNSVREEIMRKALMAKFSQNHDLRRHLFLTKGTVLVECSPFDKIWGIGVSVNDKKAGDPKKWKGQNLLGKLLTGVRDELWELPEFRNEKREIEKQLKEDEFYAVRHFENLK